MFGLSTPEAAGNRTPEEDFLLKQTKMGNLI